MKKTDIDIKKNWPAADISLVEFDIPSPCQVSWENMKGDEKSRLCQTCDHHVYNFSSMNSLEIANVLNKNQEKVCIHLYKREDCKINLRNIKNAYSLGGLKAACLFVCIATLLSTPSAFGSDKLLEKLKELAKAEQSVIKAEEAVLAEEDATNVAKANEFFQYRVGKMAISPRPRLAKIRELKKELEKTQGQISEITKKEEESAKAK